MVSMPRAETLRSGPDQAVNQTVVPVRRGRGKIVKRAALALLLLAGTAGAAWYRLRLLDDGPVHGLDRRRLREGGLHDDRARRLPATSPRCWSTTTRRSRPARPWRGSTIATSARRWIRPRPMSRPRAPASTTSTRRSACSRPRSPRRRRRWPRPRRTWRSRRPTPPAIGALMQTGAGTIQQAQHSHGLAAAIHRPAASATSPR